MRCSLSNIASLGLPFGLSIRAGLSEKWHSASLRRWTHIVHGCSPLHFCFLLLQLSQALRHRSRAPGAVLALGILRLGQNRIQQGRTGGIFVVARGGRAAVNAGKRCGD